MPQTITVNYKQYQELITRVETLEKSCHNNDITISNLSGKVDTINAMVSPIVGDAQVHIDASQNIANKAIEKIQTISASVIHNADWWLGSIGIAITIAAIVIPIIGYFVMGWILTNQRKKALEEITGSIKDGVLPHGSDVSVRETILKAFVEDEIFKNAIKDLVRHEVEKSQTYQDNDSSIQDIGIGNLNFSDEDKNEKD